jgi:hypothetical protein
MAGVAPFFGSAIARIKRAGDNRLLQLPEVSMRNPITLSLIVVTTSLPAFAADEDKWSTVKGKVVFDDSKHRIPLRVAPKVPNAAEAPACIAKDKEFLTEDWMVDPKTKAVKNAFVWLAPEPTADEWKRLKATGKERLRDFPSFKPEQLHPDLKELTKKTVEMDQPCCRFIPHVLAVRVGQTLVIKNSADFSHNAKYDTRNNGSDNPIIPAGKKIEVPIKEPERFPVLIQCSMHPWMKAYVRVFDHPYFAITNENGDYEIAKAPAGKYRIFVWHAAGGASGGNDGRFGFELAVTPKATAVKTYSVTIDETIKTTDPGK